MYPYGSVLGYELVTSQPSRPIMVVWPEYRTWFIGPCVPTDEAITAVCDMIKTHEDKIDLFGLTLDSLKKVVI